MKKIKGFIAVDFAKKGWRRNDSAIFVYRKVKKSETWFIPCEIKVGSKKINIKTNKNK